MKVCPAFSAVRPRVEGSRDIVPRFSWLAQRWWRRSIGSPDLEGLRGLYTGRREQ